MGTLSKVIGIVVLTFAGTGNATIPADYKGEPFEDPAYEVSPNARAQSVVDSSTLQGKVLFGYQGWFACAGDGSSNSNWRSWARGTPVAETLTIDMYPDLRELDPDELYPVPNMTIGGKPAFLYSANNRKTVLRHFQWMKEYGLDGVLVQRFVGSVPGKRNSGDIVLKNVMAGAEKFGRTFAIEYDITGGNPDTFFQTLRDDWKYLVDDLKVTSHPNYLHHNGKPVLSIWGMGLEEDRHVPRDPEMARQVIEWFKTKAPKPYQVTYMGGTPSRWRTLTNDCRKDPGWTEAFRMMDVIQPWTVGRYRDNDTVDQWKSDMLRPDLAWTATNGPLYMPVIFPGFSWHNLKRETPKNAVPRNRGEFLWRQAFNAKQAGAVMLKIAMFDEVNESTAMFKLAARRSDAPDQGYWLTLDADGYELPSDWYLRIAGEITRMFRGEIAPTPNLPEKLGPPRKAELEKPASVRSATVSKPDGERDDASPSFQEMMSNWPCFRGTGGGLATWTNVPLQWDVRSGAGVLWKAVVPAPGHNSPIVWGDRVFLSGGDKTSRAVFCFHAVKGDLLWQRALDLPPPGSQECKVPESTGMACPTMVADGHRAYAIFANGDLAAFDFDGKRVWARNLGLPDNPYGHTASLALWRNRLIVQMDQGVPDDQKARLFAFDSATGQLIWEKQRPVGSSWSSPIIAEAAGKTQILTLAAPWAIAYDAKDGSELWRFGEMSGEITPSPLYSAGLFYVISPSEILYAIKPDGQGDITKTHVAWSSDEWVPDICSPVCNGELLFTLTTSGTLTCFDAKNGKKQWDHDFEMEFRASPSIAGNRLYLLETTGKVIVLEVNRQFKELARSDLAEPLYASPAFVNDRIYIRSAKTLFCIGGK